MFEYRELSPVFGMHYLTMLQSMEHSPLELFGLSGREGSFTKLWSRKNLIGTSNTGKTERLFLGPDSKELQRAIKEIQKVKFVITGLSKTVLSLNGFRFRGDASKTLSGMSDSGVFLSGTVLWEQMHFYPIKMCLVFSGDPQWTFSPREILILPSFPSFQMEFNLMFRKKSRMRWSQWRLTRSGDP